MTKLSPKPKITWPFIAATLVAMALVATGLYYWRISQSLRVETPPVLMEVEAALADQALIGLAHANIAQMVELDEILRGEPDREALLSSEPDLAEKMLAAGIKLREVVDQVIISLHLDAPDEATYSFIVTGSFDTAQLIRFLKAEYQVAAHDEVGNAFIVSDVDEDSCRVAFEQAVHITADRISITKANQLERLLARFASAPANPKDLSAWSEYREGRLASFALFSPQDADKFADGLLGHMLAQLTEAFGPVESGFAGVTPQLLPPGVELDVTLNSTTEWARDTAARLTDAIAAKRAEIPDNMPTLARLFDRLKVEGRDSRFTATVLVDRDALADVGATFGEVLSAAFGGLSVQAAADNGQVQERIDDDAVQIRATYSAQEIPPFASIEDQSFAADWSGGPFGVAIEELSIDTEGELEIKLKAEGRQIENLGKDSELVYLHVDTVNDVSGVNRLKMGECGAERNEKAAIFDTRNPGGTFIEGEYVNYLKASAEKTVRLQAGASLDELATIEGRIILRLPTTTESTRVDRPFHGQAVEREGLRVAFRQSDPNSVAYEVSGHSDRLLAVRALNESGGLLAWAGSSSSGGFMGHGKSHHQQFHGQVAQAELVLATRIEEIEYPFVLSRLLPTQEETFPTPPRAVAVLGRAEYAREYELAQAPVRDEESAWLGEPMAQTRAGPFRLDLYRFQINDLWGANGQVRLTGPPIPQLHEDLGALTLVMESAVQADGSESALNFVAPINTRIPGYRINGEFKPDPDKPYLESDFNLSMEYEGEAPNSIRGHLALRVAQSTRAVEVPRPILGEVRRSGELDITPVALRKGQWTLSVGGDRKRIVSFDVLNRDGQSIATSFHDIEPDDDSGSTLARLRFSGEPETIVIHLAEDMEVLALPFEWTLSK